MSLMIEELLIIAKKLTNRLKDDESKADILITQTKNSHGQIEAMMQFSDDVEKLNEAASQRPHSVIVAGLQRESQHIKELQAENNDLRSALGDHQNALQLIMSKYRQQISQLMSENKVELTNVPSAPHCTKIILDQSAQIDKMKQVMREAAEAEEQSTIKDHELISRLITENKGLRELLSIYKKYGNPSIVENEEEPAPSKANDNQLSDEAKS